jgi:hypothetical protein
MTLTTRLATIWLLREKETTLPQPHPREIPEYEAFSIVLWEMAVSAT